MLVRETALAAVPTTKPDMKARNRIAGMKRMSRVKLSRIW
jgi:hypothetical protein